jgi:hypothetical protein
MADHATSAPGSEETKPPSVEDSLGWEGAKLDDIRGSGIGWVEGVYVDSEDGTPQWLLVRVGRFRHYSLLPFTHAVAGAGRVWVPYDRHAIRRAPRVDASAPLTRELELELCAHFGIVGRGGRAAAVSDRPGGSVTARRAASE